MLASERDMSEYKGENAMFRMSGFDGGALRASLSWQMKLSKNLNIL
jgi:hypothetical protein